MKHLIVIISASILIIMSALFGCREKEPKYVEISSFDLFLRDDSIESYFWLKEGDTCKYSDLRLNVQTQYISISQNFQFSLIKECQAFQYFNRYFVENRLVDIKIFSSNINSDYTEITDKCYFEFEEREIRTSQEIINEFNLMLAASGQTLTEWAPYIDFVIKFDEDISDSLLQNIKVEIELDNGIISDTTDYIKISN